MGQRYFIALVGLGEWGLLGLQDCHPMGCKVY